MTTDFFDLGDRMKAYEAQTTSQRLIPLLPVVARIDGRAFHSFTKGMVRPFDVRFRNCMLATTLHLVKETGARVGYTQSDEISLGWYLEGIGEQMWFDGKVFKIISGLAASATSAFQACCRDSLPEYADLSPTFDARVWNVPNLDEAVNAFLWRERDAVKNSVSALASCHFSDKELFGKSTAERRTMLEEKGVRWEDFPYYFKRGSYVRKYKTTAPFTTTELESLPEKHAARLDPNLQVERSRISIGEIPPLSKILNQVGTLFYGVEPTDIQE